MKQKLILALWFPAAVFAQDYFPLQTGNQWIYRVSGGPSGVRVPTTFITEITSTRTLEGKEYFQLEGLPSGTLLLRRNEAGTLVFFSERDRAEHNWVAFEATTGEAFRTEIDPCNTTAVIQSKNAELHGAIGDFREGALRVGYGPIQCADAGLIAETFLPYVGLAQRRMSNIAGEVVWDLIYTRLGRFTSFSESDRSFQVSLNGVRFAPDEPITVRMALHGATATPWELTFPSGQDFDIVIRNSNGEEVYRWSEGRFFTQAVRTLRITGERNFVAAIRPNLAAGTYSLMAVLAVLGPKIETTLPLEIR